MACLLYTSLFLKKQMTRKIGKASPALSEQEVFSMDDAIEAVKDFQSVPGRFEPVSYTHLDVYKRQS